MSKTYPTPLTRRLAYDQDGTTVITWNNGDDIVRELSQAQLTALNSEDNSSHISVYTGDSPNIVGYLIYPAEFQMSFIFPQQINFNGLYISGLASGNDGFLRHGKVYTSSNSTNGVDGDWTLLKSSAKYYTNLVRPTYRFMSSMGGVACSAIKIWADTGAYALFDQFNDSGRFTNVHIYGEVIDDSTRLVFTDVNGTQASGGLLDFEDMPKNSLSVKSFRLKNLSASATANNITVSIEALTDPYNTNVINTKLSMSQNGPFTSSLSISNLGPSASSDIIYVQRFIPEDAKFSVWSVRAKAIAESWS